MKSTASLRRQRPRVRIAAGAPKLSHNSERLSSGAVDHSTIALQLRAGTNRDSRGKFVQVPYNNGCGPIEFAESAWFSPRCVGFTSPLPELSGSTKLRITLGRLRHFGYRL